MSEPMRAISAVDECVRQPQGGEEIKTRSAAIEQMLSEDLRDGTLSWLAALPSSEVFKLRLHRTLDEGSDDYLDVYECGSVDEDDYLGQGEQIGMLPDGATLLEAAVGIGARGDRWVNEGVIQDECGDLRSGPQPVAE